MTRPGMHTHLPRIVLRFRLPAKSNCICAARGKQKKYYEGIGHATDYIRRKNDNELGRYSAIGRSG